ncbi:MAG TPA: hypothetical protein VFA80_15120 [Xanthobacteraceae bacterium]|nr:hypothetical protein [Xanthobacteraceae bacterium]
MNKVDFWRYTECKIRQCLDFLWIFDHDADNITEDLMRRLRGIPLTPPSSVRPDFFGCLGVAMADLVTAEQRLVAARTGKAVGLMIGELPQMPFVYNHPFLMAVRNVVDQIKTEANNECGRRTN